jgi:DNA-3-methyladenine glycosylase I
LHTVKATPQLGYAARVPKQSTRKSAKKPTAAKKIVRCDWSLGDPLLTHYHDVEWGVPIHDDQQWFEKIILDGAQAGLSWLTILRKRDAYREAFLGFDPERVARFTARDRARLMRNAGIVRNRLKIESAVKNARGFLAIQAELGSFDAYIWQLAGGKTLHNRFRRQSEIPAKTPISDAISKDLKRRGFSFVGSTIVYAFMQAAGLVNDHLLTCHRHQPIKRLSSKEP